MGIDPLPLEPELVRILSGVTTATLTTVLLKKGLRNLWMRGTKPLKPGQPRVVARAFTLRFVPAREDLATPASSTMSRALPTTTVVKPDSSNRRATRLTVW